MSNEFTKALIQPHGLTVERTIYEPAEIGTLWDYYPKGKKDQAVVAIYVGRISQLGFDCVFWNSLLGFFPATQKHFDLGYFKKAYPDDDYRGFLLYNETSQSFIDFKEWDEVSIYREDINESFTGTLLYNRKDEPGIRKGQWYIEENMGDGVKNNVFITKENRWTMRSTEDQVVEEFVKPKENDQD